MANAMLIFWLIDEVVAEVLKMGSLFILLGEIRLD